MGFYDTHNMYHRTRIVIDKFDNGATVLRTFEEEAVLPPCAGGAGCRACDSEQEACEYDPMTGYCGGRMP